MERKIVLNSRGNEISYNRDSGPILYDGEKIGSTGDEDKPGEYRNIVIGPGAEIEPGFRGSVFIDVGKQSRGNWNDEWPEQFIQIACLRFKKHPEKKRHIVIDLHKGERDDIVYELSDELQETETIHCVHLKTRVSLMEPNVKKVLPSKDPNNKVDKTIVHIVKKRHDKRQKIMDKVFTAEFFEQKKLEKEFLAS